MTMGQRILRARQEAGMSQRELAGEEITRNMLSALEHDTANPSVATLKYLSEKLCKPMGYFLGEDTPQVQGYPLLVEAREAYDRGAYRRCLESLSELEPGEVLGREVGLLKVLASLALAEQAMKEGRLPYARELLAQAEESACPYFTQELRRRMLLLQAKCAPGPGELAGAVARFPDMDEELLLRARAALNDGRIADAGRYLDAAQDRKCDEWNYLRGEVCFAGGEYARAAEFYHRAEKSMDVRRRLEICYRELEDYKLAYFYAKQ